MSCSLKLTQFLDEHHAKYVTISHSRAYTAQEIAAAVHISGKELAKSVIVKINGDFMMAVLPATCKLKFDSLKNAIGKETARLASEDEFKSLFPDCEIGAMPPFGNLYSIPVYIAESLEEDAEIAFNAGTHTEVIRMTMSDYKRIVNPKILKVSEYIRS